MVTKRRLTDLFQIGAEVKIDDGKGDPIVVWVQKMTPVDHETAVRKAQGVRARVLAEKNDTNSDRYQQRYADISSWSKSDLVEYLATDDMEKKRPAFSDEFAEDHEWNKDSYLQGLNDAWADGMQQRFQEDPEDVEAARVFNEMKRFNDDLEVVIEKELGHIRGEYEERSEEKLLDLVIERYIDVEASLAWYVEFRKCELWLSVRDPDNHRQRYFTNRAEVDELSQEVLEQLYAGLNQLDMDTTEGKDSPGNPASSTSSESPAQPETGEDSGPQNASQ